MDKRHRELSRMCAELEASSAGDERFALARKLAFFCGTLLPALEGECKLADLPLRRALMATIRVCDLIVADETGDDALRALSNAVDDWHAARGLALEG